MTETNTTRLYRIENRTLATKPDGRVSHEDIVGQWFTPGLDSAATYLRKSTQTFGKGAHVVDGAKLVVTDIPTADLKSMHVSEHPIAAQMDVEGDNYLVPADAGYPRAEIDLDEPIGELRGKLGQFDQIVEARRRLKKVAEGIGEMSVGN